jgi:hypothetical protein
VPGKKNSSSKSGKSNNKRPIEQYDHKSKTRVNNPPVGLVTPQSSEHKRCHHACRDSIGAEWQVNVSNSPVTKENLEKLKE